MWARHYSVAGSDPFANLTTVALDHSGDVAVAGSETGNLFNYLAPQSTLLKYSPSGHRIYTVHPAQLIGDDATALFASSRTDDVYLVGATAVHDYSGSGDIYKSDISKIDPSGNAQVVDEYTGSPDAPNQFFFDGATFDPLLDTVYTINSVDFTPGTNYYDSSADDDWATLKYRLGG